MGRALDIIFSVVKCGFHSLVPKEIRSKTFVFVLVSGFFGEVDSWFGDFDFNILALRSGYVDLNIDLFAAERECFCNLSRLTFANHTKIVLKLL
ncbi:hypothetical protein C462_00562 [Halorubrum distributum JCM 13916]|uniref:Uncharacterized protein n=1 Tax=Halorubrum distributum JCM 13916 TaxID=1230455 RepID=M0PRU3_9EURY|nr:hypothetical protein C462_00562 [Halorubrum arcis JCM 13916]